MEKLIVDYSTIEAPPVVKNFMPDVYREQKTYICILGGGDDEIRGTGNTIEAAFDDWTKAYESRTQK